MVLVIVLIGLALLLGGIGLIAKLAWWAFVLAVILLIAAVIVWMVGRGKARV